MTSTKPYLIRACYEWIADNGLTPYILVDASMAGVEVPLEQVEDGKIVLNVGMTAVRDLELGNDWISFSARFSGVAHSIVAPVTAVLAIYAKENGKGMALPEDPETDSEDRDSDEALEQDRAEAPKRPHLKLVD
ncbi:MAG: ClpXP protease specificity-enhancing factor [Pseudomonadota bacterium]